jgi:hypothetical protein
MMDRVQDPKAFKRLVTALEPWLDQVVIIGGWAQQLYRLHPDAQPLDHPPLLTLDTDVALPARMIVGKREIRERLLAHGFAEEFLGDDRPPATHYHLGGEAPAFYAEFLTPLTGSEYGRDHKRKATMEIGGITSQPLRHIELLLNQPWWVALDIGRSVAKVRIANPVSFIAQKILIHKKRDREDRAKDILYVHETLEVFAGRLPKLQELWRETVAPQLQPRIARTISKASEVLFGDLSDDIRRAAEISAERALPPESIRAACRYGLTEVFMKS